MQSEIQVPGDVSTVERMAQIKDQEIAELVEHERKKKSPYRKWVQMNNDEHAREADDWLIAHSPVAYRIFKFLVASMDNYNAVICSYKVIQEKFGYGQATVARAIKLLKDHKYIDVAKSGTSNIYMINKQLYWNSWGSNYAFAEFEAKVIISASEQDYLSQNHILLQIKHRNELLLHHS